MRLAVPPPHPPTLRGDVFFSQDSSFSAWKVEPPPSVAAAAEQSSSPSAGVGPAHHSRPSSCALCSAPGGSRAPPPASWPPLSAIQLKFAKWDSWLAPSSSQPLAARSGYSSNEDSREELTRFRTPQLWFLGWISRRVKGEFICACVVFFPLKKSAWLQISSYPPAFCSGFPCCFPPLKNKQTRFVIYSFFIVAQATRYSCARTFGQQRRLCRCQSDAADGQLHAAQNPPLTVQSSFFFFFF